MFEIIPSDFMRELYEKIGFKFTDSEKATLIWNAPNTTWQERLDALQELADSTEDEVVNQQINERLAYEKKALAAFKNNDEGKYVYVVEAQEDSTSCGFFTDYDKAVKYAVKYGEKYETKCSIQKYIIVKTDEDDIVRNSWMGKPNLGLETEQYSEYDVHPIAEIFLKEDGEINSMYSHEPPEDEEFVDEYKKGRFEFQFIKMPFELYIGAPVKDLSTNTYGILAEGKKEWDKYMQHIEENELYVDFSDIQVIVYKLRENGYWSHEHVNPLYLEVDFPREMGNDPKGKAFLRAMEALGEYLYHKNLGREYCPELVLKSAKEYAKICKKGGIEETIENAKVPEDIMW